MLFKKLSRVKTQQKEKTMNVVGYIDVIYLARTKRKSGIYHDHFIKGNTLSFHIKPTAFPWIPLFCKKGR